MKEILSFVNTLISKLTPFMLKPAVAPAGTTGKFEHRPLHLFSSNDDRETVEVTRRRREEGAGPGRERAQAPGRRREDQGALPSQRSQGGMDVSGGGIPVSMIGGLLKLFFSLPKPIMIIVLLVLCCIVAYVGYVMFQSPGLPEGVSYEPPTSAPLYTAPATDTPRPAVSGSGAAPATSTPRAPSAPSAPVSGQKWLVMLYQDATDQVLDHDIYLDLNEAERTGSTDRVRIVSQIDRYLGRGQSSNAWPTARRFYVTRDSDLNTVRSQQLMDVGRVNSADPKTLIDFATWAIKSYPSDKYVLILSDHGMGWPGGWSDPAASGSGNPSIPLASRLGNLMYLNDLDKALGAIRSQTGVDKFELIGMDACLMSQIEVLAALAPHGRYAVVSEETEPALGWAYTSFLDTLTAKPDVTGAELAQSIVKSYIVEDQRIVDDQARAELAGRGSMTSGLFGVSAAPSAAEVARELGQDVTLTAIDLQAIPALMSSLNNYAFTLQQADQRVVSQARSYAQSFTSIFGKSVPPSYIDLGHFVVLLARSSSNQATVMDASKQLASAIDTAVIAEKHGPAKPGATGISIYFPNSQLYGNPVAGPQSYTAIADRFASESLWDDFLAYFYTGRRFTQTTGTVAVPQRGTTITAPGAAKFQVSRVRLSDSVAAPGKPVELSVDVDGQNVGYVRLFAGYYDRAANSIQVADEDYMQSSQTRELNGVYYPAWPESGKFTVKFEWEPIVFAINDNKKSVVARFAPETYGASSAEATYTVEGVYTFADGSGSRSARLYFRDQLLRQVVGFTYDDASGAPREITPKPGDTFTVMEKWLDLDASGNVVKTAQQKGDTLTFSGQPWKWKELDAAPGEYVVGFIVEDLDGIQQSAFGRVTVR
jgi:Clostripain family